MVDYVKGREWMVVVSFLIIRFVFDEKISLFFTHKDMIMFYRLFIADTTGVE